jgi:hypothetical protein
MNVGGIKETRRKLVCNVCKVKSGTCVRCSHGMFCCSIILCHYAFIIFLWYTGLVSIATFACLAAEPVSNAAYKSYCYIVQMPFCSLIYIVFVFYWIKEWWEVLFFSCLIIGLYFSTIMCLWFICISYSPGFFFLD